MINQLSLEGVSRKTGTRRSVQVLLIVCSLLMMLKIGILVANPVSLFYHHFVLDHLAGLELPACKVPQYFGMNVDMSQIVPDSPFYVKNDQGQDPLDILAGLGANMVRLTNSQRAFPDNPLYTKEQWFNVLDKLQSLHMHAVIVIEAPDIYAPLLNDDYFGLLDTYINTYGLPDHPAVYAIDIKNEPYFSKDNLAQLAKARAIVKAHNKDTLVTIGGWRTSRAKVAGQSPNLDLWSRPRDIALANDIIDVVSLHLYGFDTFNKQPISSADFTAEFLLALRLYTDKPILISEFGAGNGDAITDQMTLGSKQLQLNTYEGVFYAVRKWCDSNVIGAIGYTFYAASSHSQGWNIVGSGANELYPVTDVFRWQADNANIAKPFVTMTNIPHNYLLTNQNNHANLNVHIGDSVTISLPDTAPVILVAKTNGIFVKQDLKFEALLQRNTAILVATSKGMSTFDVKKDATTLYSYVIRVQ